MTESANVDLRLSSLKTGSKANPRLVWSVGVSKDFLEHIPEDQRKATLVQEGGQLGIQLGTEGVLLSSAAKGNFAYAGALGERHLTGLTVPEMEMPAQRLKGSFVPVANRIMFQGELPQTVASSFRDMEALRRQADPENHFPGTHFVEDIREEIKADEHDLESPEGAEAWFNNRVKMGSKNIHTEQALMTPALADVLIAHNDGNRPIRVAKLSQYVDDITNNRWEFNGETIIISKEGLMNNGQHRAMAVQETGIPIPVLFVFGIMRETRKTVDTGSMRGPHDQLSADGYPQPTTMAALARFVLSYERNENKGFANLSRISGPDVYERAVNDPAVAPAASYPYRHASQSKRLAPPSVFGFCYYAFSKVDAKQADDFLEQVITGVGLAADSAAYVTREKLMELSGLHREQKIEVLFRGFNAFRKGKPVKSRVVKVQWELPQL